MQTMALYSENPHNLKYATFSLIFIISGINAMRHKHRTSIIEGNFSAETVVESLGIEMIWLCDMSK